MRPFYKDVTTHALVERAISGSYHARMDTRKRIPPLEELPTPQEAARTSATWVNRGVPCKNGHLAPYNRRHGYCRECLRIAQERYEQSERGRERQRAAQARYERSEKGRAFEEQYVYVPTEASRAYARAYAAERYVAEVQAVPSWLTEDDRARIKAIYADAAARETPHHVDHIIPLVNDLVCGLHVPWNLQVLTKRDNLRKGNKFDGTHENDGWRVLQEGLEPPTPSLRMKCATSCATGATRRVV